MSSVHVSPLRQDLTFGARISGVTLALLQDEQVREQLRQVFDERGMIVFEDVEPDGKLQVEISEVFGPLKDHPIPTVPRADGALHPGVIEIGQAPREGNIVDGRRQGGHLVAALALRSLLQQRAQPRRRAARPKASAKAARPASPTASTSTTILSPELRQQIEGRNILYTPEHALPR